jgi:hypothetical protein
MSRRFQFSLKWLFAGTLVVSAFLATFYSLREAQELREMHRSEKANRAKAESKLRETLRELFAAEDRIKELERRESEGMPPLPPESSPNADNNEPDDDDGPQRDN